MARKRNTAEEIVEVGAQGEQKMHRSYLPVETWSAHCIRDEGFRSAVAEFLAREAPLVKRDIEILKGYGPYREG